MPRGESPLSGVIKYLTMFFKPEKRDKAVLLHDVFKGLIVPRPIGWISTQSLEGKTNIAPYSFFNGVLSWPNLVAFSSEDKKDTLKFSTETMEFTWNVATWELRDKMNLTSAGLKTGHSEFDYSGLRSVPGVLVGSPRVAESPASLECKVTQILNLVDINGDLTKGTVVFGQVVGVHIDPSFISNGKIDTAKLRPIARCGYDEYCVIDQVFKMTRPSGAGDAYGGK